MASILVEALKKIGSDINKAADTRRDETIIREGKAQLRSAVADIGNLEGLEATRAAEAGYGDAALQANSPMLTAAQRNTITGAHQDKFDATLKAAITKSTLEGQRVAQETGDINKGQLASIG